MPVCDGGTCQREIPFRITKTALQMGTGNVAFSVANAHRELLAVLAAAKCWNLAPPQRAVTFKNLCKSCWDKQAASWGVVGTYTLARARTTDQGVFLQVQRPDFQENNIYSKEAILSCVIHELMHFWSNDSVGIQAQKGIAGVDWDEMVADVMGFRVYQKMYRGTAGFTRYLTPYNTYCVSFDRMKTQFQNVFGRLWREADGRSRLPSAVRNLIQAKIDSRSQVTAAKVPAADTLVIVLQEYFLTWFFSGPDSVIWEGKTAVRIQSFLQPDNLSNMFPVTNVYQPYDGSNKAHNI
jgi:hypothetical protein